jgi:hypothetical protein
MKILDQPPDRVVGEGGHHGRLQAEAAAQSAGHVVLAAALPGAEGARGVDALLAGVEAQHDFAQRYFIPEAGTGGLDIHDSSTILGCSYSLRLNLRQGERLWTRARDVEDG